MLRQVILITLLSAIANASFVHVPMVKKRFDADSSYNLKSKYTEPHFLLHNTNKLAKREDASYKLEMKFEQIVYEATLYIGSSKTEVTVLVDTGSADLVVNSAFNKQCVADTSSTETDDYEELYELDEEQNYCVIETIKSTSTYISSSKPSIASNTELSKSSNTAYPTLTREISTGSSNDAYITLLEPKIAEVYNCARYGVFDQDNSTTFQNLSVPIDIVYGDGTEFRGYYGTDNVYFGDVEISNLTFGVNADAYKQTGILGIGFKANEYAYQEQGYSEYDNFPARLKALGLIEKIVYSFYAPYNGSSGDSILFGGYDSNGYDPDTGLTLLPIIDFAFSNKIGDGPYYLSFTVNSILFTDNDMDDESIATGNAAVILDTGSTASVLPYYIFNELLAKFGFQWSDQVSSYIINESDIDKETAFISFNFQGAIIKVPVIDFTLPVIDGDTLSVTGLRSISANYADIDYFLLGDDFLSSVYFVADLDDKTIAIGQINADKTSNNIVVVTDSITDATKSTHWDEIYGYEGTTVLTLVTVDEPNNITTIADSGEDLELYIIGTESDLGW